MPSLEFDNLPLIEVTCNLMLAEPLDVSFDTISAVRGALKNLLPHTLQVFSGLNSPAVPFALVVGPSPGATFGDEQGTVLIVAADKVSASWRRRSEDAVYVRFAKLVECLRSCASVLDLSKASIVNMAYANLAGEEHGPSWELIETNAWPPMSEGRVKDYNVAWELPTGVEFRLQVTPQQQGSLITTSAGVRTHGDWQQELERVHETLQIEFERLMTDKAKEAWKWRQA